MSVEGIGNTSVTGAAYQTGEEMIAKTYSYKNGKGQETTYHLKDCLQLSADSYSIPIGSDTYEEIKALLKRQNSDYMASPGNKIFHESYEIMKDFYDGKLSRDDVKDIFKEYFYHSIDLLPNGTLQVSDSYRKQVVTRNLAGLYEHFSRANTRNACAMNNREGRELLENSGLNASGAYYYNADWYWACEEMQELFRETANELADEYGAARVDFDFAEKNTRFTLDGGITYHGVWNSTVWQRDAWSDTAGQYIDADAVPPRGFIWCSCDAPDGNSSKTAAAASSTIADRVKKAIAETDKSRKYAKMMFLLAVGSNADIRESLLFDKKNYYFADGGISGDETSDGIEEGFRRKTIDFLKNFHIKYRSSRMEFLRIGE